MNAAQRMLMSSLSLSTEPYIIYHREAIHNVISAHKNNAPKATEVKRKEKRWKSTPPIKVGKPQKFERNRVVFEPVKGNLDS